MKASEFRPDLGELPDNESEEATTPMELRCVWCDFPLTKTFKYRTHQTGWCRACGARVRGQMRPMPGLIK